MVMDSVAGGVVKTPPHNLEAEQSTLGSMLLDRTACDKAAEILTSADFYRNAHQVIFESILNLIDRNEPVDPVTVCESMQADEKLDKVGGRDYVISLMDSVPSSANVEFYARIVERKAILRRMLDAAHEIEGLGYSESEDVAELVDRAERLIFKVGQRQMGQYFTPILPLLNSAWEQLESRDWDSDGLTGVPTGFDRLDQMTSGLQPNELIIVAARPSMGKTALALNFAVSGALATQKPVAIFSLEMSKEQLVQRMICSQARVDAHRLRTGRLPENVWTRMAEASDALMKAPIFIDDAPDCSAMAMRTKCRRLKAEHHGLAMVVVDYMQLMRWHRQTENRNQEISEIARSLKALAREMEAPVIALSQLSRQTERREDRKPILSDLRESGSIEAEADVVMMIYRPEYYKQKEYKDEPPPQSEDGLERPDDMQGEVAEIIIAKQRNGPTGTVRLSFIPKFVSFENLAENYEEPE